MSENTYDERFPLKWPTGWKRTPFSMRKRGVFGKKGAPSDYGYRSTKPLEISDGLERLYGELRRLGAQRVVVSSDLRLRNDGTPYRDQRQPDDPGVAVYFRLAGAPRALACDKWTRIADNLAAIAGHIEAIRMQDRYGVGTLQQAFAGYAALPPSPDHDWRVVLELPPGRVTVEQVETNFRKLARTAHPDVGGSVDAMSRINAARDAALAELNQ